MEVLLGFLLQLGHGGVTLGSLLGISERVRLLVKKLIHGLHLFDFDVLDVFFRIEALELTVKFGISK